MLRIFGATENIDLESAVKKYLKDEEVSPDDITLDFPEYDERFHRQHINKIVKYVRDQVNDAITNRRHINIITGNVLIFDAVRAEIHKLKDASQKYRLISFLTEDEVSIGTIDVNGRLCGWPKGIFDTDEILLDELLDI